MGTFPRTTRRRYPVPAAATVPCTGSRAGQYARHGPRTRPFHHGVVRRGSVQHRRRARGVLCGRPHPGRGTHHRAPSPCQRTSDHPAPAARCQGRPARASGRLCASNRDHHQRSAHAAPRAFGGLARRWPGWQRLCVVCLVIV